MRNKLYSTWQIIGSILRRLSYWYNLKFNKNKKYKMERKSAFSLYPLPFTLSPYKSFTLIELLVSAAILTAIVTLTIGSFVQSVNFGSTSTEQRIVRQTARSFSDWITRRVRQVSSVPFGITNTPDQTFCVNDDTLGVVCAVPNSNSAIQTTSYYQYDDYAGNGYVLLESYTGGLFRIADPAAAKGVNSILIPVVDSGGAVTGWTYIGSCNSNVVVKRFASPVLVDDPCADASWVDVGQVLPAEIKMTNLKFYGVPPKALKFDGFGNVISYNYPVQPYLTWSFKLAPISDLRSVISFETTITSRDYNFAYPSFK
jgi:type II secretory pathway pseudopilin PulG